MQVAAPNSPCSLFIGTRKLGKRKSCGVRGKTSATWLQRFVFLCFCFCMCVWAEGGEEGVVGGTFILAFVSRTHYEMKFFHAE